MLTQNTICIADSAEPEGYRRINEEDFNPLIHTKIPCCDVSVTEAGFVGTFPDLFTILIRIKTPIPVGTTARLQNTAGVQGGSLSRSGIVYWDGSKWIVDSMDDPQLVSNIKLFGAVGDGIADDTIAIQNAINAVQNGGTVHFPKGTYSITSVNIRHGLTLEGDQAVITRPNNTTNFVRTFTTQNNKWNSTSDSPLLVIRGITFDGNRSNQGLYTGYELEQAHMIFLEANSDNQGRLRVNIENCIFREGCADGISVYNNVDINVSNCFFHNIFRCGIGVTGGWVKARLNNLRLTGDVYPARLDVEIDGGGYGSTNTADIQITNIDSQGDADFTIPTNATLLASNMNIAGAVFNFSGAGKTRVSGSRFKIGLFSGTGNRITTPGDMRFENCEFLLTEQTEATSTLAAIHLYWQVSSAYTSQKLVFRNCLFGVDGTIESADTTYGIYTEADTVSQLNSIIIDGCEFKGLDEGVHINQGGKIEISDTLFDTCATAIFTSGSNTNSVKFYANNLRYTNCMYLHNISNSDDDNVYHYTNTDIDEATNTLTTVYGWGANIHIGGRRILGSAPPTSVANAFKGDIWQLKSPTAGAPYRWIATNSSYSGATTWKVVETIAA